MKFGLNISKATPKKPSGKSSIFAHDESDDSSSDEEHPNTKSAAAKHDRSRINKQIGSSAVVHQKIKEAHDQALQDDPNIFDYDAVYDDLKAAEQQRVEAKKGQKTNQKAKYIHNLLAMAEVRKRDRLLAEEKKISREREAEGEAFADKEVFMTESYKQQKAELERIEQEERQREEQAARKANVNIFYKQFLEKKEAEHQALLKASKDRPVTKDTPRQDHLDNEKLLLDEAREKGVALNDSNEVVDKRDLLGAGLNVAKRPTKFGSFASLASTDDRVRERQQEYEDYKQRKLQEYQARLSGQGRKAEREKLSQEIESQMVEIKKKAEEDQARRHEEKQQAAAKKRTTDDVALSARERYLARKKQKSNHCES
ncbi:hypothetical protein DM01DRAFT_1307752 [Hesseltinella vesiculosa]|uniref:Nuclear speckle splicing regulatory protein 1 N-terminal domain-containing protein n=1 Tax=Hesseltinella vesiculosa TaxID=101127 RepID=A0A1X2GDQ4_9FUNG|nr:hypothetical protein DM01DRAFT_1307752 [Hesseltinella vesiculosa]